MDEMWACPQCHSLNDRRDQRCYKCGLPMTNQQGGPGDVRSNTLRDERAPNTFRNQALAGAGGGRDLNAGGGNAGPHSHATRLPLWVYAALVVVAVLVALYLLNALP
ncbi:MAG: hypothetical protein ACLQHS_04250 [Candidatus Limnocylindrales bacterium]